MQAEQAFLKAIEIEPYFAASYLNLSELYRRQNKQNEATGILVQGLSAQPKDADIPFSLGLAYIRQKQTGKAVSALKQASQLAPNNGYYQYVYAIALESSSPKDAVKAMQHAYKIESNPRYLYSVCEMQLKHKMFGAKQCLQQLQSLIPDDDFNQLLEKYAFPAEQLN